MNKNRTSLLLLILLWLSACTTATPTAVSTQVAVMENEDGGKTAVFPTSTPVPPATPTHTPIPTIMPTETPIPYITMSPFPTVTPVGVYPVKQVLLQAGWGGGDGGDVLDDHYGRGVPDLVIYTDGQVIIQDYPAQSGQLSTNELCVLLTKLKDTGYFNSFDDIYAFDETTPESDGAGSYTIQVNGPLNQSRRIYGPHQDYLIDEIANAYQLISAYQPPITLTPYVPEHLVLWIGDITDTDTDLGSLPDLSSLPEWPANLPPLADLRDPTTSEVVIEGEMIPLIMELFNYTIDWQLFREGDTGYQVILRSLLPHETPQTFTVRPSSSVAFSLPFTCNNMELPETVIPTSTPIFISGTVELEDEELLGRIVYTSNRDDNDEIYVMYADGSNVTRLTNYPGDDRYPAWSPDGQKIAFISDRSGYDELYMMDDDGSNVTRLTFTPYDKYNPPQKYDPAWSPYGTHIVYIDRPSSYSQKNQMYVVGVENSEPGLLTQREGFSPSWFSQTQIMYVYYGGTSDTSFYLIKNDVSNVSFTTTPEEAISNTEGDEDISALFPLNYNGYGPTLSPDKKNLAYYTIEWHETRYRDIYVASMTNSTEGTPMRITKGGVSHSPAWSPDGKRIVFVSEQDGNAELYVMDADGSNPIRLTFTTATERDPDWTP